MNIKSIISKLIVVLIVAFTAISVFWFFKTSAVKKHILALISSSHGTISAASVSVTGFPLKQQLTIDDLKLQISPFNSLPESSLASLPNNLIVNNKYQVQVKKMVATASIFSGDFTVGTLEEVAIRDQSGVLNVLQYNQAPVANFSVSSGMFSKFSYTDSGYKILDAGKNVLFENGNSLITFESANEGDKQRHKLKAEFKDVGALSFSNDMANPVEPAANPNPDVANLGLAEQPAPVAPVAAPAAPAAPTLPTPSNSLVKKSFSLDVEYVVVNASSVPAQAPAVPTAGGATDALPVNIVVSSDDKIVESVNIKNFEILSPLYKVNIYGEIKPLAKASAVVTLSAKIEKLDNVLTYIKKSIVTIPTSENANKLENVNDVTNNPAVNVATTTSPSDSTGIPAATQKPEADVAVIIKDLSKKNAATNEVVAMFDFRQEEGKDLLVNEIPMKNVMNQIFMINPTSSPVPTNGAPDAAAATGSAAATVTPSAPIPASAPINPPAAPAPAVPAPVVAPAPVAPASVVPAPAPAKPANVN